jgi:uncharacterized protein
MVYGRLTKLLLISIVMQDEHFEWHDEKASRNWLDHAISFEMAREAFKDAFSIDWTDDRQDTTEERLNMLGMVDGRLLHVSYTLRGERIRIISARKAEPHEQRRYHNENRET